MWSTGESYNIKVTGNGAGLLAKKKYSLETIIITNKETGNKS